MSSLILELHLTPDAARVILSALSMNIINYAKDASMDTAIDEEIEMYKEIHELVDRKWPNWLYPNPDLKAILEI